MAEKRLTKEEKAQALEHGNDVLTEHKLARALDDSDDEPVKGLEIISELASSVDTGLMTMPEARKSLGSWFVEQSDRAKTITEGRARIRRFKQIADALYEEFSSLCSSASGRD